ncbi:shugoshin [Ophiobolus disseminans]|uniref:Shugoshin n=1 Tax=Ophiobolus disseminans TaxID=1469910 RepID=A0A6A7ALJ6_9PLEO|nr:shugoshin [Ophiobolus disseminans]
MARLNEPPLVPQPSAETIDAIKRRFLRQNRELAKTNSQQSIRIRSLENDCSRLLAENLSLREQVLQLQNTLESHSSRPSFREIDAVKAELEAKMLELGSLVAGLGQLKKVDERPRCKSQLAATRRSPDERQWRSGLGLQEVENQMMPTITEGKSYPRRTMGADELREILDDPDSQSPDLGPPPISRFDNEEPISFNPSQEAEEQLQEPTEDGEPALSVNLETRKKRRESGPKLNIRRVSVFESPPENIEEAAAKIAKAGAKRKFSVQEDEDKHSSQTDAFRFSRRNAPENEAPKEDGRPSSPERPVLASKPVNTDPVVSPKKQRQSAPEKPERPEKPVVPASRPRNRARLNISRTITPPELPLLPILEPVLTADIILDALPPKTPAVEDIFSPPSTEPSTSRPESKDTPPPGDLSAADQIGAGRPGRRARPQVSYKEPSLHTKMRRPDAKLVDAIVDRRTSVEPQAVPSTTSKPTIKRETSEELGWKPVSAISGRTREEEVEPGSPLRQKLDRRETDQESKSSPASEPAEVKSSTASKAISALISETSTAKRKLTSSVPSVSRAVSEPPEVRSVTSALAKDSTTKQEHPDTDNDNLAIFDFTDSSPADTATNPRIRITELAKAARNARRHSSVPASSLPEEQKPEKHAKPEGALPSLHKRTGSGNVKISSTASLGKSTSANSATARLNSLKEKRILPPSSSSIDLKARANVAPPKGEMSREEKAREAKEVSALRAERAASRRKSMML